MGLIRRACTARMAKPVYVTPISRSHPVHVSVLAPVAMVEGSLLLSLLLKSFRFDALSEHRPTPVAHLTVRSNAGIWLKIHPRSAEFRTT